MDYTLIIQRAEEGGYWAEVAELPGCFVQGEALDELLDDAPDAIASHVAALQADGQPVPQSRGIIVATVRSGLPAVA